MAGIGMTIIKTGVVSESMPLRRLVGFREDDHLAEIGMTIIKAGVVSEKCYLPNRQSLGKLRRANQKSKIDLEHG